HLVTVGLLEVRHKIPAYGNLPRPCRSRGRGIHSLRRRSDPKRTHDHHCGCEGLSRGVRPAQYLFHWFPLCYFSAMIARSHGCRANPCRGRTAAPVKRSKPSPCGYETVCRSPEKLK